MDHADAEPMPYDRSPSAQSRVLATAVRFGVRPFSVHVPGRRSAIVVWRALLGGGSWFLRTDSQISVHPINDPWIDNPEADRPVRGEWLRPPGDEPSEGAVLYLHGGGYAVCSPQTHRALTTRLSLETEMPVFVPMYRRAPEHPFPAAFEDAQNAYQLLLARGIPAERIVIAGDSAGGHLASALVAQACRDGLPAPAGVVLFSPWVDLTSELAAGCADPRRDPYLSPAVVGRFGRMYVGDGDWTDPRLSLLDCASPGLPPFLIQVGGIELLRTEGERLAEAIVASGGSCELQVWPGQMHVFQIFNRVLPEARNALRDAARFIRAAVGAPPIEAVKEPSASVAA